MQLDGSCHCGRVKFSVWAQSPVPFMRCYCSICRKTAGSGGFGINLGADASTLAVHQGHADLRIYRAHLPDPAAPGGDRESSAQRHFCGHCGSALWLFDPRWPALVHPHAGAIDTPLPVPPAHVHLMLGSKANWVEVEGRADDERFNVYPSMSLAQWHEQHGLASPPGSTPSPV